MNTNSVILQELVDTEQNKKGCMSSACSSLTRAVETIFENYDISEKERHKIDS